MPEDHANGLEWYDRAKRMAKKIAQDTGLDIKTVIGVMAALSPNNRWERNCRDTHVCVHSWRSGHELDQTSKCHATTP